MRTLRPGPARSLHARAADDLRFIRATMERAASFTALPGWGGVLMGMTGMLAAAVARSAATREGWLATWLCAATIASLIGAADVVQKARAEGSGLRVRPATGLALALGPAFLAGVALSAALWRAGAFELLPGAWLVLYGAGVVAASAFTRPAVRWMGGAFLALGALALAFPFWGDAWLGAGFGGLHVAFGLWIARHGDG